MLELVDDQSLTDTVLLARYANPWKRITQAMNPNVFGPVIRPPPPPPRPARSMVIPKQPTEGPPAHLLLAAEGPPPKVLPAVCKFGVKLEEVKTAAPPPFKGVPPRPPMMAAKSVTVPGPPVQFAAASSWQQADMGAFPPPPPPPANMMQQPHQQQQQQQQQRTQQQQQEVHSKSSAKIEAVPSDTEPEDATDEMPDDYATYKKRKRAIAVAELESNDTQSMEV